MLTSPESTVALVALKSLGFRGGEGDSADITTRQTTAAPPPWNPSEYTGTLLSRGGGVFDTGEKKKLAGS